MASGGKKKKGEDGASSGGADYATFKKPAKLDAEDDLVSYLRSLEQPLIDLLVRVEDLHKTRVAFGQSATGGTTGTHKRSAAEAGLDAAAAGAAKAPKYASVACLGDSDSEAALLVKGVYRELSRREASLTSHKRCSEVLELLLRLSTAAQLARYATAIAPYIPFLAFNRYGSHVLQTLLGLVYEYLSGRRVIEPSGLACVPSADEQEDAAASAAAAGDAQDAMQSTVAAGASSEPEAVRQVLLSFVLGSVRSLGCYLHAALYHDSATHVLRSLICLLSGLPPGAAGAAGTSSVGASTGKAGGGGKGGKAGGASAGAGAGLGQQTATVDSLIDAHCSAAVRAYGKAQGKQGRRELLRALVGLVHAVCAIGGAIDMRTGVCPVVPSSSSSSSTPASAGDTAAAAGGDGKDTPHAPPKPPADLKPFLQSEDDVLPLEELGALCCDVHASATMQTLLAACAHAAAGTGKVLARRMLNVTLAGLAEAERDGSADYSSSKEAKKGGVPSAAPAVPGEAVEDTWAGRLVTHAIGSRVMELLLATADGALFEALLQRVLAGQLASLCADAVGNFVVQRLLLCCRTAEQSENVLRELLPHAGTLSAPDAVYGKKREGVLLHMVSAAVGCPSKRAGASSASGGDSSAPAVAPSALAGASSAGSHPNQQYGQLLHAPAAHGRAVSVEVQKLLLNALAAIVSVGPEKASVLPPPAWYSRPQAAEEEEEEAQGQEGSLSAAALSAHTAAVAKGASEVLGRGSSDSLARFSRYWLDINGGRARKGGSAGAAGAPAAGSDAEQAGLSVPVVNLSPTGVRMYAHLLQLHPSLARPVAESLLCLKPAEVLGLACEPSASRHIIEPLIEGRLSLAFPSPSSSSEWAWIGPKLCGALSGHWAALAISRFGCWTVTKMAHALQDGKKRAALAEELLHHERAVTGSASGRTVWRALRLDHFKSNSAGWQASWTRGAPSASSTTAGAAGPQAAVQAKTAALLQDIMPSAPLTIPVHMSGSAASAAGTASKHKNKASEETVQKAVEAVLGPQVKKGRH